ncbi:YwiC-like family protein [Bacillus sp. FJAT-47783]|uniref:YwiC-like family protein n=1 Tax=Bacillus sp. FJAT-47783 TaxID=2922712 RepID=UPI001FAB7CF4|nr:YwiC-like family protein [Bacillus sp. FJAT-47783]
MGASKKLLLPKQHGAWAMLVIPFLLGGYAGGFSWFHIPLFIGWLFLYLATYPLLMSFKIKRKKEYLQWFYRYFFIAITMLLILLFYNIKLIYFGIAMVPFFFINLYYAKKKNERAFINDVAAIMSFCIGALTSYYVGSGELTFDAFLVSIFCFFFFIGSTFYVKTMIREKKNEMFKWFSWGYHILLIIVLIMSGYSLFTILYVPSVLRAVYLYGKKMTIMKVGIMETVNAIYFCIAMLVLL